MSEQTDANLERAIEEARAFVAARPAPDLTGSVMRRIEELGVPPAAQPVTPGALSRLAERLWAPRRVELQWRPGYALVAAAAAILLIVLLPYGWRTPTAAPASLAAVSNADPRLYVQFRLEAADAMDVRLAGSFTNWQPSYALHQASPGSGPSRFRSPPASMITCSSSMVSAGSPIRTPRRWTTASAG